MDWAGGTDGFSPAGFKGLSLGSAAWELVRGLPVSGWNETGPEEVRSEGGSEEEGEEEKGHMVVPSRVVRGKKKSKNKSR